MDPPNPELQEALRRLGREAVIERHDKLEEMIADSPYLTGDHPTLADAVFIGVSRWLDVHQVESRQRWPRLDALRTRIEAEPAVRYAQALEDGLDPAGSGNCRGHVSLNDLLTQFAR
jgi:glutathione S-transferase